jgi:hypothetical protein
MGGCSSLAKNPDAGPIEKPELKTTAVAPQRIAAAIWPHSGAIRRKSRIFVQVLPGCRNWEETQYPLKHGRASRKGLRA